MAAWLGPAIGAASSLIGGLLGNSAQRSAQKDANRRYAEEAAFRRDLATHGIRWKVEDAKAAGIHPVYALGASTPQFSPISSNFSTPDYGFIGKMGQDIGRAVSAGQNASERRKTAAYQEQMAAENLKSMKLRNEVLRTQLVKMSAPQVAPARPAVASSPNRWLVDGQGDAQPTAPSPEVAMKPKTLVVDKPLSRTVSDPRRPHMEPGATPDVGFVRTRTGWAPVQSKDAKERLEEDWIGSVLWNVRNRVLPTLGIDNEPPPNIKLPKGYKLIYNPIRQEYQPHKKVGGVWIPWKMPQK